MRVVPFVLACALAAAPALPAQDIIVDRVTLGNDTLFGPGIVEVAVSGSSVKLRTTRPAHILVMAFKVNEVARQALPRPGTRTSTESRARDQWVDLFPNAFPQSPVTGSSRNRTDQAVSSARAMAARSTGANVALVIAAEQPWDMSALSAVLPKQADLDPMWSARSFAEAATSGRADAWVAWIVRW
jgi:hypothetical protein